MPGKLPEVEVARRNLERWFKGRHVVRAEASGSRVFRGGSLERFHALKGRLVKAERHGKHLMLAFEDDQGLLAHLGMTGKFVRRPSLEVEPYSRAAFLLDNGQAIHFRDPRMFGRLMASPAGGLSRLPAIESLGPDLLLQRVTPTLLKDALGTSKQPIKVALLDQSRLAGLGNIHAAEALFRARIHPSERASDLGPDQLRRLSTAIRATLAYGLKVTSAEEVRYVEEGETDNPFLIYGRGGEPCSRCKTPIASFTQGGRTTYYCPSCQPKSKVSAKSKEKRNAKHQSQGARPRGHRGR